MVTNLALVSSTEARAAASAFSGWVGAPAFDQHHTFLASLMGGPASTLQGFRQHGPGVVLTFVVDTTHGIEVATKIAIQRTAGLWPNARPVSTTVHVAGG